MRVSYTKLATFETCHLQYRLKYVERLKAGGAPPQAASVRIHAALRQYHQAARRDGRVDVADVLRAYDSLWPAQDAASRASEEYHEGEDILRAYAAHEAQMMRVPLLLEHPVNVSFGPYNLVGRIDRVDAIENDEYAVIDYKLTRGLPQMSASAMHQLKFYQLLLSEKEHMKVTQASIYYLRQGAERDIKLTPADLRTTTRWVDNVAGDIDREHVWAPCEGPHCKTCPFKRQCPAKTGEPRPGKKVYAQIGMRY